MAEDVKPALEIAVVGGGIAGIYSAYQLAKRHRVTLFEKEAKLGGHTNTRILGSGPDKGTPIDTGFIVCNPRNYPTFYTFLGELDVALRDTEMSFGMHCELSRLHYMGPSIREFLRRPLNLLRPRLISMLLEQRRFGMRAQKDLSLGEVGPTTLKEYLERVGTSEYFADNYVLPLAASIWSTPSRGMDQFPAAAFLTFFKNHGMLDLSQRPQWQTVVGGSETYIRKFEARFDGEISLNSAVESITRGPLGVEVRCGDKTRRFDAVFMATHADDTLRLLSDADGEERRLLGSWSYTRNLAVLHSDAGAIGGAGTNAAAWNFHRYESEDGQAPLAITYNMNRLQGLRTVRTYYVTLNPVRQVRSDLKYYETEYTHPQYSGDAVSTQNALRALNGLRSTYFCGAYMHYGFHEDAVLSAAQAIATLESKQ